MTAFWVSVVLVFLAEMGDKTQFATAALAVRYSARLVLTTLTIATLASHLFSVYIGRAAHLILPQRAVDIAAGLAFIAFGLWTLRPDTSDSDQPRLSRFAPFFALMFTFFITELGDKTMLATVAIAAQYSNVIAVWIGSTLGMLAADALAIVLGRTLLTRLPERMMRPAAATIFLLTGAFTLARVFFLSSPGHV